MDTHNHNSEVTTETKKQKQKHNMTILRGADVYCTLNVKINTHTQPHTNSKGFAVICTSLHSIQGGMLCLGIVISSEKKLQSRTILFSLQKTMHEGPKKEEKLFENALFVEVFLLMLVDCFLTCC